MMILRSYPSGGSIRLTDKEQIGNDAEKKYLRFHYFSVIFSVIISAIPNCGFSLK